MPVHLVECLLQFTVAIMTTGQPQHLHDAARKHTAEFAGYTSKFAPLSSQEALLCFLGGVGNFKQWVNRYRHIRIMRPQ